MDIVNYEGRSCWQGALDVDRFTVDHILVFGSNTQGRHGKGTANVAMRRFGAVYGVSSGLVDRSFAIVTKDLTSKHHPSISRQKITHQIVDLYRVARRMPLKEFVVPYNPRTMNLNGYNIDAMARMFADAGKSPSNILFELDFYKLIVKHQQIIKATSQIS